uniref:Uncharacterized protein n=1 Tax=Urocitellus parryii TaxID=9999 RepID=A0A8D2ICS1_UROPR
MSQKDRLEHLFARGRGCTEGAILTCPWEVVKTQLQSSLWQFISEDQLNTMAAASSNQVMSPGLLHCLKVSLGGKKRPRSLFKGFGPQFSGGESPAWSHSPCASLTPDRLLSEPASVSLAEKREWPYHLSC